MTPPLDLSDGSPPFTLAPGDHATTDERAALQALEHALNPANPVTANSTVRIVGYGEVSTAFTIPALPDLVCKRMVGFRDARAVSHYLNLVAGYITMLRAAGILVVDTRLCHLPSSRARHVVYLLQSRLDDSRLGNRLLRDAGNDVFLNALDRVLSAVLLLHDANDHRAGNPELAIDGQLSNWFVPADHDRRPMLIDVGTPFVRLNGCHLMDSEVLLAPVPQPLRWYYRRQRAIEKYFDDYFDPRTLALDLLGNFHKEGRPDRISIALDTVNTRLAAALPEFDPIRSSEVDAYYQKDVALLELYLRARKADRFIKTRLLRRYYPYVLPGSIPR
jgi:hypothetical protein